MYIVCMQCREYKEISLPTATECVRWVEDHFDHTLIFDDGLEWFNKREADLTAIEEDEQ